MEFEARGKSLGMNGDNTATPVSPYLQWREYIADSDQRVNFILYSGVRHLAI